MNRDHKLNQASCTFNVSDFKNDKTQYFDKTPNRSQNKSPFEPQEFSARSTLAGSSKMISNLDFDDIMKSSNSEAVRNKYRESMENGRLSTLPRTADISLRSSSNVSSHQGTQAFTSKNVWGDFTSFSGKNFTYSNEDFKPAEEMAMELEEDEARNQIEYASIPRIKNSAETTQWDEITVSRQPEISFGQYCLENVKSNNIREVYNNQSPPKKQNRVPLVEVETNEKTINEIPPIIDDDFLKKMLKTKNSPLASNFFRNLGKNVRLNSASENPLPSEEVYFNSVGRMMQDLCFDKIIENTENEISQIKVNTDKENHKEVDIPVQDKNELTGFENEFQNRNRGLKRRTSASNDTPRSALEKCFRSKSPSNIRDLEVAAAKLKPKITANDGVFKVPSSVLRKSPARLPYNNDSSSREYLTATDSLTLRSSGEKLSLPNYTFKRPNSTITSPTSSVRSVNTTQWSPNASEGQLKRSVSQLSNGSEFTEDVLPIKINNIENRKLSFESVKIDRSVTKSISIQNGSNKKLPLRVRVIGAGFTVVPKEEFRMVPNEARTFHVKFTPSVVGPAKGALIFELSTKKDCARTIQLYGYGGHSSIYLDGILKGPYGPPFISMGNVNNIDKVMEQKIRLVNRGTLPSFVSLVFEKTKLSDFVFLGSLSIEPTITKINPGESVTTKIRFKATKMEIRKILALNKEVITIGEICIICGDEPTRLRILKYKQKVEPKFLNYLPLSLPGEFEIKEKLLKFNEELSCEKLTSIMSQIRTHEIALTLNRNLDDTQCLSAEISLSEDTQMNFETFIDVNSTCFHNNDTHLPEHNNTVECIESKYFKIIPSTIEFNSSVDNHTTSKNIVIESLSQNHLFLEAVSSHPKLISAIRACGKLAPSQQAIVTVYPTREILRRSNEENIFVVIIINNSRIEIPVIIRH